MAKEEPFLLSLSRNGLPARGATVFPCHTPGTFLSPAGHGFYPVVPQVVCDWALRYPELRRLVRSGTPPATINGGQWYKTMAQPRPSLKTNGGESGR